MHRYFAMPADSPAHCWALLPDWVDRTGIIDQSCLTLQPREDLTGAVFV
jgi:hypothetical protein